MEKHFHAEADFQIRILANFFEDSNVHGKVWATSGIPSPASTTHTQTYKKIFLFLQSLQTPQTSHLTVLTNSKVSATDHPRKKQQVKLSQAGGRGETV